MIIRRVLEDAERNKMTLQHQLIQIPAGEFLILDIVECPSLNDVLFRQVTAVRNHPGIYDSVPLLKPNITLILYYLSDN